MMKRGKPHHSKSTEWAFMKKFEIPSLDEPDVNYLTRWRLVQTPWVALYLHRFDRPDSRPTLHDHPWPFASLVVWGKGYVEISGLEKHRRVVRFLNLKRATDVHYIESLLRPVVWTLVLVGRRRRSWGYVEAAAPDWHSIDENYEWTRFDLHSHAAEFDRAMKRRG